MRLMYGEREDSDARKNALGAVQKLSLRRSFARMMIKNDIVQWVVDNLLTQQDTLSDYTLRYSLALLMNISLRSIGEKFPPQIMCFKLNIFSIQASFTVVHMVRRC